MKGSSRKGAGGSAGGRGCVPFTGHIHGLGALEEAGSEATVHAEGGQRVDVGISVTGYLHSGRTPCNWHQCPRCND